MRFEIRYNSREAQVKANKAFDDIKEIGTTQYERGGNFFIGHNFYAENNEQIVQYTRLIVGVLYNNNISSLDYQIVEDN